MFVGYKDSKSELIDNMSIKIDRSINHCTNMQTCMSGKSFYFQEKVSNFIPSNVVP